jgi:hypothetical protein
MYLFIPAEDNPEANFAPKEFHDKGKLVIELGSRRDPMVQPYLTQIQEKWWIMKTVHHE